MNTDVPNILWRAVCNMTVFMWEIIVPPLFLALILQLCSQSIRRSCGKLLGHQVFIYLTAPGVVVHELSHALFCLFFGHKITEMKLFSPAEDGVLGYVVHSYDPKNYYQKIGLFFIGTAPIWGGIGFIFLVSKILLPPEMLPFSKNAADNMFAFFRGFIFFRQWASWHFYLWLYVVLTIGSHITLSRPDLAGAAHGFFVMCGIVFLVFVCLGWSGEWEMLFIENMKSFLMGQLVVFATIFCMLFLLSCILKLISVQPNGEGD